MNNLYFIKVGLASMACMLVGCTAISPPAANRASSATAHVNGADIESQLLETASSIDNSLKTLAASQTQLRTQAINTDPLTTPEGGMGGLAAIDWAGPIEPLLEKIAALTDYRVKFLGHPPAVPIIVSLSEKEAVIADILKNAGLQAAKRANIVVYPDSRIIELRYASLSM